VKQADYDQGWSRWSGMVDHSPAPFHRRRMICNVVQSIAPNSVLDVGCGNGALLGQLRKKKPVSCTGVDLSEAVLALNRSRFPHVQFHLLDISKAALESTFEVVICSEVLEHIDDVQSALRNLRKMCTGYLLITVPRGPVFPIDKAMGHVRHFTKESLGSLLKSHGLEILSFWEWGFPFHTAYKYFINLRPNESLQRFAAREYSFFERLISKVVRGLFYLNLSSNGLQIVCLARVIATNTE